MLHLDPVPQVWGITGNLGGGKTLSAVSLAVWGMSRGYYVVSNVTLKCDVISDELGIDAKRLYQHFSFEADDFDPFKLPCGSPRGTPGGKRVLVILDEAAEWVDQYASAQLPRIKRFKSWLRHSSKRSQDVLIIVQRLDYLQKDFRLLISKWLIVDDLRVWRVPIMKMTIPLMGGFVMQRVFDRTKKLVQGPCLVRKATYGRFYNTAECLNLDGANSCYEYVPPRVVDIAWLPFIFSWVFSLFVLQGAVYRLHSRVSRLPTAQQFIARPYQRPFDQRSYDKRKDPSGVDSARTDAPPPLAGFQPVSPERATPKSPVFRGHEVTHFYGVSRAPRATLPC